MSYYNLTKLAEEHPADTVAKGVGTALIGTGAGALLAQRGKADKLKELREKVKDIKGVRDVEIAELVNKINDKTHPTYHDIVGPDKASMMVNYSRDRLQHLEDLKSTDFESINEETRLKDEARRALQGDLEFLEGKKARRQRYVNKLDDNIKTLQDKAKSDIAGLKDDFNKFYTDRTKRMALRGLGASALGYGAYKAYQHAKNKPMAKTASDEQRESLLSTGIKGLGAGILSERIGNAIGNTISNKHKLRDMKNLQEDIRFASGPFERKIDFNNYDIENNIRMWGEGDHEKGSKFVKEMARQLGEENATLNAEKAKAVQKVTDNFNKKHQDIASRAKKLGGNIGAVIGLGGYGGYKAYQHFRNKEK